MKIFNENYFQLFNENVPLVRVKIKSSSKSWFTPELNEMMNERKIKYDLYASCPENDGNRPNLWNEYMILNKRIKNSAESSLDKWRVLKSTGCSKEKDSLELDDNITLDDLNQYFISIHKSSFSSVQPINSEYESHCTFNFELLDHSDILAAFEQIKSTAIGADNISIKF